MARTEKQFGYSALVGTTYVSLGQVPAATKWNLLLNVANRTASSAKLRAYIADTTWTTGEPTGTTLVAAIAYDRTITAGDVFQVSGVVMSAGQKLVVYSSVASSLDCIASGVEIA